MAEKKSSRKVPKDGSIDKTVRDAMKIDYEAEGSTPPDSAESHDRTDDGYDRAARSGGSRFGVPEGNGGVFGTSGGGTYPSGFHVEERSGLYDRSGEVPESADADRTARGRGEERFDQVNLETAKTKKK